VEPEKTRSSALRLDRIANYGTAVVVNERVVAVTDACQGRHKASRFRVTLRDTTWVSRSNVPSMLMAWHMTML